MAKDAGAKKAAPKKASPKAATKKAASKKDAAEKPEEKPAAKRDPALGPVQKTRVVSAGGTPRTKTRVEKTRVVSAGGTPRTKTRVEKTRVVFPKDWYEEHKDEVKAPFKLHGLKWNYLGEGKGLYKREKEVHCFAQFLDDGTHYSLWGDDKRSCEEILKAWRTLAGEALWARFSAAGESATQKEAEQKESEDMRLWKIGEPQRRPGEPDFFFKKRYDEWMAKKPA